MGSGLMALLACFICIMALGREYHLSFGNLLGGVCCH